MNILFGWMSKEESLVFGRKAPDGNQFKKKFLFISCGLIGFCLHGSSQTESPPVALFSFPSIQLRAATLEPPQVSVVTSPDSETELFAKQLALTTTIPEIDLQLYRRLEEGGYLTRLEGRSENYFTRSIDAIFVPEVVHLGKTAISCSIITALKRKNPLCLINPIFFSFSW